MPIFSEELFLQVCDRIALGNFETTSCRSLGVVLRTWEEWRKKAKRLFLEREAAIERGVAIFPLPEDTEMWCRLHERLEAARCECEARCVEILNAAAQSPRGTFDTDAAKYMLEHGPKARKERWETNYRTQVEVSGRGGGPIVQVTLDDVREAVRVAQENAQSATRRDKSDSDDEERIAVKPTIQ